MVHWSSFANMALAHLNWGEIIGSSSCEFQAGAWVLLFSKPRDSLDFGSFKYASGWWSDGWPSET